MTRIKPIIFDPFCLNGILCYNVLMEMHISKRINILRAIAMGSDMVLSQLPRLFLVSMARQ